MAHRVPFGFGVLREFLSPHNSIDGPGASVNVPQRDTNFLLFAPVAVEPVGGIVIFIDA